MCRAIGDGGRRCPCSYGPDRSAYRKRLAAAKAANGAITDSGDVVSDERKPAWRPEQLAALADQVSHALETAYVSDPEAHREAVWEAQQALIKKYGSVEEASTHIGEAVRQEAEKRAGVDLDAVTARFAAEEEAIKARHEAVVEKLLERAKALSNERAQLKQNRPPGSEVQKEWAAQWEATSEGFLAVQEENAAASAAARAERAALQEEATKVHTALAEAYRETLAELRPMGGVEMEFHARTTKGAQTAFNEATKVFPTDWLNASNAISAPVAKVQKSRAHYARGVTHETKKRVLSTGRRSYVRTDDIESELKSRSYYSSQYRVVPAEEAAEEFGDVEDGAYVIEPVFHEVRRISSYDPDTPPKGRGWSKYTDDDGAQYWTRPKTRMRTVAAESAPEIKTSKKVPNVEGASETYGTAVHELSHRMEHAVPQIARLEGQFLYRRAAGEELRTIYRGTSEKGYEDNFPLHYAGKVYPGGVMTGGEDDGGDHYELVSCGSEALFAGNHGGFIGASQRGQSYSRDDEYRSFVLGVFATAGRSR